MNRIKNIVSALTSAALYAGIGWVLLLMFLTVVDVTGRYFLSKPVSGSIEMSRFMLAAFGILGMAYTHSSKSNIRVTMLIEVMPQRVRAGLDTLTNLLSLQVVGFIAWYGMVMGMEDFHSGSATDTLSLPLYPLKFLLSAGAFLMGLEILMELLKSLGSMFHAGSPKGGEQGEVSEKQ